MRQVIQFIVVVLVVLVTGVAAADYGSVTDTDTLQLSFKLADSLGKPVAIAAGDSLYLAVFSSSGTVVYKDSVLGNNAGIKVQDWEDVPDDYCFPKLVSVLNGSATTFGPYIVKMRVVDVSLSLSTPTEHSFMLISENLNTLLARLDAAISTRSIFASATDSVIVDGSSLAALDSVCGSLDSTQMADLVGQVLHDSTGIFGGFDSTQMAHLVADVLHDSTGLLGRAVWRTLHAPYDTANGTFGQMNNGSTWSDSTEMAAISTESLLKAGFKNDSTAYLKKLTVSGTNGSSGSLTVSNLSGPGASFSGSVHVDGYREPGISIKKMRIFNSDYDDTALVIQATGDGSVGVRATGVEKDWYTVYDVPNFSSAFFAATGGGSDTTSIKTMLNNNRFADSGIVQRITDGIAMGSTDTTAIKAMLANGGVIANLRKMSIGVTYDNGVTGALQIANGTGPAIYARSDYPGTEGAAIWGRGRAGASALMLTTDSVGGVSGPTVFITAPDTADAVYVANLSGDSTGGNGATFIAEGGGIALSLQSAKGATVRLSKNDGTPGPLDTVVNVTGGIIVGQYDIVMNGDTISTLEDLASAHGSGAWTTANVSALALQSEVANLNGWNPATDSVNVDGSAFALIEWAKNMYVFLGWGEIGGLPVWSQDRPNAQVDTLFVGFHLGGPAIDTVAAQMIWHVAGAAGDPPDTTTSVLW